MLATLAVHAGDMCPAPPHRQPHADSPTDDHLIHIESDSAVVDNAAHDAVLTGRVTVHQDERSVSADSVTYDELTGHITVTGNVDFENPQLRVQSAAGSYDQSGGADFNVASFELLEQNGHGTARELSAQPNGQVALEQVRYTSCPVGDQDWMLQASSINLDTVKREGVARHAWFEFEGVPIFYTPYISFPIGDERRSGFLVPLIGHSGSRGIELGVPYYFNLAPNYDLTVTPEWMSKRGTDLSEDFRFLTGSSRGEIQGTYLPDDLQTHSERSFFHLTDVTDILPALRVDANLSAVSDVDYFQDFAVGSAETSLTYLDRHVDLLYHEDAWQIRAQLQNFQTIDSSVHAIDRPYSSVPRIDAQAAWPLGAGFELAFGSEAVDFQRDVGPTGLRFDVSPELRWSLRTPGYFFEPAIGLHFTQYDLQNVYAGEPTTPTRDVPYGRLDMGLVFERSDGAEGQRSETLEPRMVYNYVPYRNQNDLPIFDTALPDLNLTELFRTNRYVGNDRIGDADQLSLGLTTRLFDTASGQQWIAATIGQIRYFSVPRVTLTEPGANVPVQGYAPTPLPGSGPQVYDASDFVGDVSVTAYKNWSFNFDYEWNPYVNDTEKEELSIQYRPDLNHLVNLAYRYQRGVQEQWDGSFAWPITAHWDAVGRLVYSIVDRQTIEQVAGVEYKSCCWSIQLVQRRYLTNRGTSTTPSSLDSTIALQFELTGLSSVQKPGMPILQRSISGYSAYDQAP
jgi:LPS-assembly protein